MAKFKYKMQNILDIKQKLEEQAKMEFAMAMAKLVEEEEILKNIQNRKRWYEEEGKKLRCDKLNVIRLQENNQALKSLQEKIEEQRKNVSKAQSNVDKARTNLRESMQERKTHEKLYDDAFDTFKSELNAQESKEVDELTSYTYGVRQSQKNDKDRVMNDGRESKFNGRI